MIQYTDIVKDELSQLPIPEAEVFVYNVPESDGDPADLATLYAADGVTTIPNPLTTNSLGVYSFYQAAGEYVGDVYVGKRLRYRSRLFVGGGYSGAAQTAAAAALAAAGVGEYASTALGLAGTSEGETFWVDLGTGLGQVYRHDAGPVATPLQTFLTDPQGSGASSVLGKSGGGTIQDGLDERPTTAALASPGASNGLGFEATGAEAIAQTIEAKLRGFVTPEDYGGSAVMNSVALAMDAASAAGVPLRCSPVDYSTDAALTPPEGLEWYANGCRINADTASGVSAVRILNDNIRIRGTLRINLTDIGGTQSAYRGHVLMGDWMDGAINPTNFQFDDLVLEGGHSNVNGFAVAGGANRIRGKSVRCGDSDKIGRLFMAHWANFNDHFNSGGTYQHAVGATPTTHPHDIIIDEVSSGNLTCNTGDFMGVVVVSAGYDTEVGKVKGSVNNPGAGGSDIVLLTAGDLGFAYATADERAAGMWGIRIKSVIGNAKRAAVNRLGRALYYNADSTPQPTDYYFAKIEDTIDYIRGKVTGTLGVVIAGTNGYGKTRCGVVDGEGGKVCAGFGNFNRDTRIDVLRCKNSFTKALEIAGSGGDTTLYPQNIEIGMLVIDGTDAAASGTQANSIGFLIQSARAVKIGSVHVKALAGTGYVGVITTGLNGVQIGETFLPSNYNASLTFAYSLSAGLTDFVSIGNVFAPLHVTQPVSGGATFRTVGRNREFYYNAGFQNGVAVSNGDRIWITGSSGPALYQVKTSGVVGTDAVQKEQLNYT